MLKNPWSLALLLVLSAPLSLCDVIELKTGERLQGTFKQATAAGVVIEAGGQPITVPLVNVRAIYFGEAPAPAASPDAPKRQALQALKELRSLTEVGGFTRRDYNLKLAEVTAKLEGLLPQPPDPESLSIKSVLMEYRLCSIKWEANLTLGVNVAPSDCWNGASRKLDALANPNAAVEAPAPATTPATSTAREALLAVKVLKNRPIGDEFGYLSQLVPEARKKVDLFLHSAEKDTPGGSLIVTAMEKYESAVQLWAGIKNPRARLPLAPPPVKVMRLLSEAADDADQAAFRMVGAR